MVGTTLGHCEILSELGTGGMGEVYVAQDTKLGRRVALKLLPPEMAADPERRARFEREAQAVAVLNHPNIVTLHSVDTPDERPFITMELVQGESLNETIPRGGMPLDKLFDTAIPIADALAAAHQQGIVHRIVPRSGPTRDPSYNGPAGQLVGPIAQSVRAADS